MTINNFGIKGLTSEQVVTLRRVHGKNILVVNKENRKWVIVKGLLTEPMVVLLLITSIIYFLSGDYGDGLFLAVAIIFVASISLYQDSRSRQALEKLEIYTQPNCKVIRDGEKQDIKSTELVPGDYMIVEEGTIIPADATIIHSNDFSVNESILTGESLSVFKEAHNKNSVIYSGTTVETGLAIATVTAIGAHTALGKLGKSLESIKEEKTPLEIQISNFVRKMVITGVAIFLVVWGIHFFRFREILESLLKALTLAMSILPEEIPVAFTTFMALGAWRLMKMGIIVKQMKTVETLGSATVICTDKTGTITENRMSLARLYVLGSKEIVTPTDSLSINELELLTIAMWASEPIPFDPMEKALHQMYTELVSPDERPTYHMIHEYSLGGKPPMMTHILENNAGDRIIAAKGAPEAFLPISSLTGTQKEQLLDAITTLAQDGYRLLGVGTAHYEGKKFPTQQQGFTYDLKGLVAFYDPPKKNIYSVFNHFEAAGIKVKIVTGDNEITTRAIAKQIGFRGYEKQLSGDELMALRGRELEEKALNNNVFTRMYPDAKLKLIHALKARGEIVAMTGDGVNDGPALKAAHIGIAMGQRGTEIAKQAASLILTDDDLAKMVDAIAMGRKIYTNLKKAIQYVISIHIPIIMIVSTPLFLGWVYPSIFSPVHVIVLELIMGPTCSIIYENEPMEKNTMMKKPRPFTKTFFNWTELMTSILQGLGITLGALVMYQYCVHQLFSEAVTRAMIFVVLIAANIFLTLVNRSFFYSAWTTLRYENRLVPLIIAITIGILTLLLSVKPFRRFFEFETLTIYQLVLCVAIGFLSVIWYELIKWRRRHVSSL